MSYKKTKQMACSTNASQTSGKICNCESKPLQITFFTEINVMIANSAYSQYFDHIDVNEEDSFDQYMCVIRRNSDLLMYLLDFDVDSYMRNHSKSYKKSYWNVKGVRDFLNSMFIDMPSLLIQRRSPEWFRKRKHEQISPKKLSRGEILMEEKLSSFKDELSNLEGTAQASLDFNVNHNFRIPFMENIFSRKVDQNMSNGIKNDTSSLINQTGEKMQSIFGNVKDKAFDVAKMLRDFFSCFFSDDIFKGIFNRIKIFLDDIGEFGILVLIILSAGGLRSDSKILKTLAYFTFIIVGVKLILNLTEHGFFSFVNSVWYKTIGVLQKMIENSGKVDESDIVSEWDSKDEITERVASAEGFVDVVDPLAECISLVVSGLIGYKTKQPFSNSLIAFMKISKNNKDNLSSLLLKISDGLAMLLKKVTAPNVITDYFLVDVLDPKIVAPLIGRINNFISESNAGVDLIDPNRAAEIVVLDDDVRKVLKNLDPKSYDFRILSQSMVELNKRTISLNSYKKSLSGERVEPVGLLIMGPPSVKKSVLLERLAKHVCYATLPESWKEEFTENPNVFIFPKPNDKFYDGYHYKSWVCIGDDFGQKRDQVGIESSEALDKIRMINVQSFVLPMAAVDSKNTTYFRSAFVMDTTNRTPTTMQQFDSIMEWKALARRYVITIEVEVNPDYKIPGTNKVQLPMCSIDLDDLEANVSGTYIPDDFWIIKRNMFDEKSGKYIQGDELSYEQLVMLLIEQYNENVTRYYVNKFTAVQSFKKMHNKVQRKFEEKNNTLWHLKSDPFSKKIHEGLKVKIKEQVDKDVLQMEAIAQGDVADENILFEGSSFLEELQDEMSDPAISGADFDLDDEYKECFPREVIDLCVRSDINPDDMRLLNPEDISSLALDESVRRGFFMESRVNGLNVSPEKRNYESINSLSECKTEDVADMAAEVRSFTLGANLFIALMVLKHPIKSSWFKKDTKTLGLQHEVEIAMSTMMRESRMTWDMLTSSECTGSKEFGNYQHKWINLCVLFSRHDLMLPVDEAILKLYDTMDDDTRAFVFTNMHDSFCFFGALHHYVKMRLSNSIHPLTGKSEKLVEYTPASLSSKILKRIKYYFRKTYNYIKENFTTIFGFLAIGSGIIVGGYFLIKGLIDLFRNKDESEEELLIAEPHSVDYTKMASRHPIKKKESKVNKNIERFGRFSNKYSTVPKPSQGFFNFDGALPLVPIINHSHFGEQGGLNDVIASVLKSYFFIIYVTRKSGTSYSVNRFGHCSNLRGTFFWHPFHFIFLINKIRSDKAYEGATISFINLTKTNSYSMTAEDFLNNFETTEFAADCDQSILRIPHAQPNSKGIYHYLLKEKDLDVLLSLTGFETTMISSTMTESNDVRTLVLNQRHMDANFSTESKVKATWEYDDEKVQKGYRLPRALYYNVGTSVGDCGALIFTKTGNFSNRYIIGMHVAGDKDFGFGTVISQELADELIEAFCPNDTFFDEEEEPDYIENIEPVAQGNLIAFKKFDTKHDWRGPSFSSLRKARVYDDLFPYFKDKLKFPAKLTSFLNSDGENINPMSMTMNNYGFHSQCIDESVLVQASQSYCDLIMKHAGKYRYPKKPWTLEQALHGFNKVKTMSSKTSSGFPMNLPNEFDLKDAYFTAKNGKPEEEILPNPEKAEKYLSLIKECVDIALDKYSKNIRPFWIFIDFLKDELRSKERSMKGETRLISGAPFILILLFRMYFGAFMDFYFEQNMDVGSAIGINPYSEHWNILAQRLKKFGRYNGKFNVGAGDYTGYDGKLTTQFFKEVLIIIDAWYGDEGSEDWKLRHFLWTEICNSKHHFMGYLIVWFFSMASGNPLTALINTMINNINMRVNWIHAGLDWKDFNDNVYMIALGDDHCWSVHPKFMDIFNELNMVDLMKKIGHVYTTETKEVTTGKWRDITEVEFLKRKWSYSTDVARYVAPLRFESIINMMSWTKKGAKSNQITMDNMGTALREFSLHGRETYNKWYGIVMDLRSKHFKNLTFSYSIPPDYSKALDSTLNQEFSW